MLVLILVILMAPAFASAQDVETVKIRTLAVDIWPEYDRPDALVIYHIILPEDVSLPQSLTFRIPKAAGDPSAVAVRRLDESGREGLFSIPYERKVKGDWGLVRLNATERQLQLEYYDPRLMRNGSQRSYQYIWPGDYPVEDFRIRIQEPLGAARMRLSPASDGRSTGPDGLMYYWKDAGSLRTGESYRVSIEYSKDTPELTAARLKGPSQEAAGTETAADAGTNSKMIMGLLVGVSVMMLALLLWLAYRRQEGGKEESRRGIINRNASSASFSLHCPNCGKETAPQDRFCSWCGRALASKKGSRKKRRAPTA